MGNPHYIVCEFCVNHHASHTPAPIHTHAIWPLHYRVPTGHRLDTVCTHVCCIFMLPCSQPCLACVIRYVWGVSFIYCVFCLLFGTRVSLSARCMPHSHPLYPTHHLFCLYPLCDLSVIGRCQRVRCVLGLGCGCYLMLLGSATGCWLLAGTVYWLI